jgi:hypothetical protein
MKGMGNPAPCLTDVQELFSIIDSNGDHQINKEEYRLLTKNVAAEFTGYKLKFRKQEFC